MFDVSLQYFYAIVTYWLGVASSKCEGRIGSSFVSAQCIHSCQHAYIHACMLGLKVHSWLPRNMNPVFFVGNPCVAHVHALLITYVGVW